MPLAIFDLDNTLVDRSESVRQWAGEFAVTHSLGPSDVEWLVRADGEGFVGRPEFLSAVRARYGLREPLEVLLNRYRERIVALIRLDPAVPVALDRLRGAGWRVAVATNGSTRQQMAKMRRTGLAAHVDAVAVSEEVGVGKPDRRMFEAAARRCGARPADGGWMIGDCPDRDIAGGHQAGLHTIWMRRGRVWDPEARPPDAIADDVPAAVAILVAADRE